MLNVGAYIVIRNSFCLKRMKLDNLVKKTGIVTKIVKDGNRIIGAYVKIKVGKKTPERYIPIESIESDETIDRMRTLSLLKTTLL